ncbi:sigma-70 family RNA polymerase sigma factor [Demequina aestuarii]|uniref:sigma-70 family RNA polymerase sigma factor n=1 Tax=Demequina aestuarii TaxID=327095 RepID=UPI0007818F72|nr:sigma-70 family RNA polymerase sigma factor [Demequina aestuarii]
MSRPDIAEVVADVYREAGSRLAAYGYVLTGSHHGAEELVQAALVKTLVKRRRLDDHRAIEGYVRATMRTLHIDGIRRDATWRRLVPKVATPDPHEHAEHVEDHDDISRALAGLPPRVRTAVALRFYDDLTVADIAVAMRLSDGTVKKYLAEGRQRLAPVLGVSADEPERMPVVERSER